MGGKGSGGKRKDFFMMIDGVRTHVRRCKTCGEIKKTEEFYIYARNTKHGITQIITSYCKDCETILKREFLEKTNRKSGNLLNWNIQKIKYKGNKMSYNIYEELLEYQQHRCAICGTDDSFNRLAMDHDHETGEARGLLCHSCNRYAVGIYEDRGKYRSEHHTNIIKTYLSDPPINHIPTSVKHGWKYEMDVFPSPSEDNDMREAVIQSPMDMWEEDE